MDPLSPASFNHRDIKLTNGRQYHICDEEPEGYIYGTTPVLLLIHGFPELCELHPVGSTSLNREIDSGAVGYEWRYQIGAFVRRGWRVIAPDTLGYGRTVGVSSHESHPAGATQSVCLRTSLMNGLYTLRSPSLAKWLRFYQLSN